MGKQDSFVASAPLQVILPYSEYEKVVNIAQKMEAIEAQNRRLQEQYTAIQGMFSECLLEIKKIRDYVTD